MSEKYYYVFVEGVSSKFWEITIEGNAFTTRYGQIGTKGKKTVKEWASEEEAKKKATSLRKSKEKKGYTLSNEEEITNSKYLVAVVPENEDFLSKIDEKSNPVRKFSGEELRQFPENVEDIEEKSRNYNVERTLFKNKNIIEKNYDQAPQFGNYIVDYGIYLLENGELVEAGQILSCANGSENFDNMWPHALFHKARIAAILEEFDYMIEFLRRSFRAAVAHKDVCGGDQQFKIMTDTYYGFQRYRSHPRFRHVLTHNFNNKEDLDEYWATGWY